MSLNLFASFHCHCASYEGSSHSNLERKGNEDMFILFRLIIRSESDVGVAMVSYAFGLLEMLFGITKRLAIFAITFATKSGQAA